MKSNVFIVTSALKGNLTFRNLLQSREHLSQLLLPIGQFTSPTEVDAKQGHDRVHNLECIHSTVFKIK